MEHQIEKEEESRTEAGNELGAHQPHEGTEPSEERPRKASEPAPVTPNVEVVTLGELKFVGIPLTSAFHNHEPDRVDRARQELLARRGEIRHIAHPGRYVCPHFSSEVLFTYNICMEVSDLEDIPEGMIGFTVPARRYAKVRCGADPYKVLHEYVGRTGLKSAPRALALEYYPLADPRWPDNVDVYLPLD